MIQAKRKLYIAAARDALWELLADTDRLNRELNLPAVHYVFEPREEGGSFLQGTAVFLGRRFHYREEPYCWVRPRFWSVTRHVENGPLRLVRPGVALQEAGDCTEVTVFFQAEPRSIAATPLAHAVADAGAKGLERMCRTFATYLQQQSTTPYPRHQRKHPLQEDRLHQRALQLARSGLPEAVRESLLRFLREALIEEVVDFRPYVVARRLGQARRAMLETCLAAVRAGILELRWRLLCPACRAPGAGTAHLADLSRGAPHCPSCNIRYGPEFDRSVEVCFSIAPDLRPVTVGEALYCIGGPERSPHAVLQWVVDAQSREGVEVDLTAGTYQLTAPQGAIRQEICLEATSKSHAENTLVFAAHKGQTRLDTPARLPATGEWHIENTCPYPVVLRCETLGWVEEVATAAEVTALQAFRDHFSSEVLSPGAEMAVRQVTLLFTDLKGSTAMYARQGDAPSFVQVREHFAVQKAVIAAHGGGVVKTMGDAVMAAFSDPAEAVQAGLEIQREMQKHPGKLPVKIGVHVGPALAVNTEDRLDYFGQTVNRAARIQAQANGGEVVIAAALTKDPRVAEIVATVRVEPFLADLKGDAPQVSLLRLWP